MMVYVLLHCPPYESHYELMRGTREEVKAYIKGPESPGEVGDMELYILSDVTVEDLLFED